MQDNTMLLTGDARLEILLTHASGASPERRILPPLPFKEEIPEDVTRLSVAFYGFGASVIADFSLTLNGAPAEKQDSSLLLTASRMLLVEEDGAALHFEGHGALTFSGHLVSAVADNEYRALLAQHFRSAERQKEAHENASRAITLAREDFTDLSDRYNALLKETEELRQRLAVTEESYRVVSQSHIWRVTRPLRKLLDFIKKIPPFPFLLKAYRYTKRFGVRSAFRRARSRRGERKAARRTKYTKAQLAEQRRTTFASDVTFSILVPLYNTPRNFLTEMINSVKAQTYPKWELCLADGSDDAHANVGEICLALAKKDPRIRYQKLETNLGISGNTNACIDMATGEFIALFDHDDLLHPAALYEMMRAIDQGADFVYTDENTFHTTPKDAYAPHFKPDYAPDTLRTNNYICHFNAFSRALLEKAGRYFRPECDGSQDYDMMLRLTEKAEKIVHIPIVLYYWRAHKGSVATDVAAKPYVIEAAHRALADHLTRVGLEGEVLDTVVPSIYRIKYKLKGTPKVSIIIANKDHVRDLDLCLRSIEKKTTYPNYEIIIVENNSTERETFLYYEALRDKPHVRVVTWSDGKGTFNYSAINNFGVKESDGEYVILLNNDIEILTPDWIEEMLMFAQREDVGAVGAKLYYPDDTIQHAGIGIGLLTLAGHYHRNFPRRHPGYMGRLIYAHNVSAVTAALVMVPRRVWDEVEGLDEGYAVAFNDVDLCMKIRDKGYLIVFTPFAEAYHYESKSRGLEDTPAKRARFESEIKRFYSKWQDVLDRGDPYYNPNLSLDSEDFSIR